MRETDKRGSTDGRRQIGAVGAEKVGGANRKPRERATTYLNAQDLERLERENGNTVRVAVNKRGDVTMAVYFRK